MFYVEPPSPFLSPAPAAWLLTSAAARKIYPAKTCIKTIAALAAAAMVFASAPADAEVFYYYKTASSSGCAATFLAREFYATDPAGTGTTYTKVADTCGLYTANDDANFSAMGFCPTGRLVEGVHCNDGGYVVRTTYEHANCFKQVLSEVTPQFCYGDTIN